MGTRELHKRQTAGSTLATAAETLVAAPLAVAGAWIAYSRLAVDHAAPLARAIEAELRTLRGERSGTLAYYVDARAEGRPLVLVHSINAAGSSYEMRPLFEQYRNRRPVYALDLPGFGFSERSERRYTPQLYADAILDLVEMQLHEPVDLIALSLSCEFAARAALARPEWFRSLAFISPTGFTARDLVRASQRVSASRAGRAYRILSFPLWAQALFDLIATRPSIRYFLRQSFVGDVDGGLEAYSYATSHQPGARHAPLYFVSGKLFTRDVRAGIYEYLTMPVLVVYDRDPFVRFDLLPQMLADHDNWRGVRVIPSNGLPQFEKLPDTAAALDGFWQGL